MLLYSASSTSPFRQNAVLLAFDASISNDQHLWPVVSPIETIGSSLFLTYAFMSSNHSHTIVLSCQDALVFSLHCLLFSLNGSTKINNVHQTDLEWAWCDGAKCLLPRSLWLSYCSSIDQTDLLNAFYETRASQTYSQYVFMAS